MADHHEVVAEPLIRRLTIERFRGIEHLTWYPKPGLNVILGGGDVGKSTILDAIALLFSPSTYSIAYETDYWRKEYSQGFRIEAVMSLPSYSDINRQRQNNWPWHWDGTEPLIPQVGVAEPPETDYDDAVYRVQVRGTEDFDLSYEILQPDGETSHFSNNVRRRIGLVRLSSDDRNDRDLRLIQGSALDRLISDRTLRARLGPKLGSNDLSSELLADSQQNLENLEVAFRKRFLPTGLNLGITGGQGLSLNALIGLVADKEGVSLPIASWGAGTRRLASLEIGAAHQAESPIIVVDEIERGLEPYRQRTLVRRLQERRSQVFLTTHSPIALRAAQKATSWYMSDANAIGELPSKAKEHQLKDPDAFLTRLTIVAEGPTEVGFLECLLERTFGQNWLELGVWITDGAGNDNALDLLRALNSSGLQLAAFVDNEGRKSESWDKLRSDLGPLVFQWNEGCTEQNVIQHVPQNSLEEFIKDTNGESGMRLRTIAERLGVEDKSFDNLKAVAPDLRQTIVEAATGFAPQECTERKAFKSHGRQWFKSLDGGRELAEKTFTYGVWSHIEKEVTPFLDALRNEVSDSNIGIDDE